MGTREERHGTAGLSFVVSMCQAGKVSEPESTCSFTVPAPGSHSIIPHPQVPNYGAKKKFSPSTLLRAGLAGDSRPALLVDLSSARPSGSGSSGACQGGGHSAEAACSPSTKEALTSVEFVCKAGPR